MTLEERIELHEQWLHSMESNQTQFAANLAELDRRIASAQDQINQITGILGQVVQHQAVLSANMAALAARVDKLAETVDRYIRFGGDGRQAN